MSLRICFFNDRLVNIAFIFFAHVCIYTYVHFVLCILCIVWFFYHISSFHFCEHLTIYIIPWPPSEGKYKSTHLPTCMLSCNISGSSPRNTLLHLVIDGTNWRRWRGRCLSSVLISIFFLNTDSSVVCHISDFRSKAYLRLPKDCQEVFLTHWMIYLL